MYIDATRFDIVTQPNELDREHDAFILILLLSIFFHDFFLVSGDSFLIEKKKLGKGDLLELDFCLQSASFLMRNEVIFLSI